MFHRIDSTFRFCIHMLTLQHGTSSRNWATRTISRAAGEETTWLPQQAGTPGSTGPSLGRIQRLLITLYQTLPLVPVGLPVAPS
jgi:hypothetical protein